MPTAARQGTGTNAAGSVRTKLIEAARDGWIDPLIDTSRRNNLLFFRPVVGGASRFRTDILACRRYLVETQFMPFRCSRTPKIARTVSSTSRASRRRTWKRKGCRRSISDWDSPYGRPRMVDVITVHQYFCSLWSSHERAANTTVSRSRWLKSQK